MQEVHIIESADEAAEILKPVRIEILSRLVEPRTCPELARELAMTTQKINYHMNILREAGLVSLVEERRKRGTIEGVYQAVAKSFWFSPRLVVQQGDRRRIRDQASLAYLKQLAEDLQIDIGRLMERQSNDTNPSLGVNAQIQLRDDADRAEFLADIKEIFSHLAHKYGRSNDNDSENSDNGTNDGKLYRLMLACYSAANEESNTNRQEKEQ